eukprot:gnl/Chilomastix_caulleri/90.p1 GENE.gnl/Chilomastix_caulleri/90~~gnl/Chilomastix_caulleri/90.p1  ORF type:complete len:203 (+),score=45.88 gnl/Chilomastix_caulleri/90:92-700(+)
MAAIYNLPELPYKLNALEPYITEREMDVHYNSHHKTYATKTTETFALHPELPYKPIEEYLANLDSLPADIRMKVRNFGGGLANHDFYWHSLSPNVDMKVPTGLEHAINAKWGSVANFLAALKLSLLGVFGSGWAWLVKKHDKSLEIVSTPNQDRPSAEYVPLLAIDVWEHAYAYQTGPNRAAYIDNIYHVIDWNTVAKRFEE